MKLYISDLHFYGESLNSVYDNRGFENVQTMNKYMLEQWNSTVKSGDIVIVLGDLFSTKKAEEANWILNRLAGKICLIEGNHDCEWLKKEGVNLNRFDWIKNYAEFDDHGYSIVACHYPIVAYNHQHVRKPDGTHRTYMLYGHVHKGPDEILVNQFQNITRQTVVTNAQGLTDNIPCHMINTFCMFSDYKPLSLEDWIKLDESRRKLSDYSGSSVH